MASYNLSGIPNDLLNSGVEGARRLKVEAVILDASETPEAGLVAKSFAYNPDNTLDTITETNLTTLVVVQKKFNWDSGVLISIVPSIL